jgi:hypothetical protein
MSGPEAGIERYRREQVKKRGGWCIKWAPIIAGTPDRLVLLPGHPIYLVETKAPGGRLRPIQQVWHERALMRGHRVHVLANKQAVDDWLAGLDAQSNHMV